LLIFSGEPYLISGGGNKEYKYTHHLFHIQNQLFMKNFTSILVLILAFFVAQCPLEAQIREVVPNDPFLVKHLERGFDARDIPLSKPENKKVADRDDPIFRLRATRSENWDNGWTGGDSIVNVYDSQGNITQSTSRNFDGAVWNKSTRQIKQYNSNNNLTELIWQKWDGFVWINDDRTTYEYDANNNLTLKTIFNWDGATWYNGVRWAYQYDGNLEILETQQSGDGANWISISRTSTEYNSDGQKTLRVNQEMNGGVWQNNGRVSYQYTGGNMTLHFNQGWQNNTWVNGRRWITEYDQNSNRTSYQAQQWDGSSWVNWYLLDFKYNAHNDLSSYINYEWINSNWVKFSQFLYEYDENYNLTQYLRHGWNGISYVNDYRTIYYYDSFVSTNESVSKALNIQVSPNPSSGTFSLSAHELDQQPCQIFLYDQLGRQCLQQACSGLSSEPIDASNLPNGTYVLQVITQDGKHAIKQIQISK